MSQQKVKKCSTKSIEERINNAKEYIELVGVGIPIYVDNIENSVGKMLAGYDGFWLGGFVNRKLTHHSTRVEFDLDALREWILTL